jgi:hypothetical protein
MPDFLTRRGGVWHFVRRVPAEFATADPRTGIRHSTRVRIADDRSGRRAARVAEELNGALECHWKSLADGPARPTFSRYDEARRCARALGYDYILSAKLIALPIERTLKRLEALVAKGGGA